MKRRSATTRRRGAKRRRKGVRRLFSPGKLIALGSLAGLIAAFWLATRQVYFVGVDESRGNVVTLYHGLPYELPLGIELYQPVRHSGVTLQSLPAGPPRQLHRSQAAFQGRRRGPRAPRRTGPHLLMSARNRELMALIPASLLVTAGFAAIFIQRNEILSNVSLTYGAAFLALCFVAHLVIRFTLPHADPYLFPLVAVLACFGLVVIYRIDEDLARVQAQWFVIGLIAFAATIFLLRDFRVLERYRYTIALAGLALLLLPRVPGIGQQVNGAYLGVGVGPISFQPSELGKIAIVIFLAAYLQDNRRVLVQGSRRILGVTIPPLKHLGPLLVVWGAAMFMLVFIRDLGSSLMYFGAFLALLYVATNRLSFVVIGLADVRRRRVVLRHHRRPRAGPHRHLARSVRDLRTARATRSPTACSPRPTAGCSGAAWGRRVAARTRRRAADPGAGDGHDLRRDRQRSRPRRRRGRDRDVPADRRARLQDRHARDATASPSCSRPA